jgi:hypothetical protein
MTHSPTRRPVASLDTVPLPAPDAVGVIPSVDSLLGALLGAASDLCLAALRMPSCRVLAFRDALPRGLVGAYAPVLSGDDVVYVGILSDVCGCEALTRMFRHSASLSESAMRMALPDLVRELANGLLARVDPRACLTVGPPVFVDGVARRARNSRVRAAEVLLGVTRATLVLLGSDALVQSDWPGSARQIRSWRPRCRTS